MIFQSESAHSKPNVQNQKLLPNEEEKKKKEEKGGLRWGSSRLWWCSWQAPSMHLPQDGISPRLLNFTLLAAIVLWKSKSRIGSCRRPRTRGLVRPQMFVQVEKETRHPQIMGPGWETGSRFSASLWARAKQEGLQQIRGVSEPMRSSLSNGAQLSFRLVSRARALGTWNRNTRQASGF